MSLSEIHNLTRSVLIREGASPEHADSVADCVRNAERDGASSHGMYRVPGYIRSLRSGKVRGDADPSLTRVNDTVMRCEGDRSFVSLVHRRYLEQVIQVARQHGVCIFAARRIAHWAALWPETEAIADAGLVAFACTSYLPTVAPHGTRHAFFGTNPVSFAWPRPLRPPLVFDMATSSSSLGDLSLKARMGEEVPEGTGLDGEGKVSKDPSEILKGCLLPFGGYKGSHLAMAVELLAGPLIGETTSYETAREDNQDGGPPLGGELIVAMSLDIISGSKESAEAAERFLKHLEEMESFGMPGQRRHQRRLDLGKRKIDAVTMAEIEKLLESSK
ncbi:hypothetical protein GUITHDRAFT_118885 [Guillardia theta CCMP2712]|uniref:Oxidoreductase n=1 Tax=Guillardia theta (strain CCMP2712) TaxID=905079 RepID=L1IGA2_GUITC|nr:hypothetical protein GUITHDRAFT_118885 [Guillardia theta CCMP2712]EKX34954.1 hypothetical protein GUITHDRAFT_118885 [Guillardia theta CCMP2712]|eukprot:XP_005821934.1 hypothetical protein GUITHDRAFT_118885 [Guillardia theta CCMP2712]